jgi:hypothetical protein
MLAKACWIVMWLITTLATSQNWPKNHNLICARAYIPVSVFWSNFMRRYSIMRVCVHSLWGVKFGCIVCVWWVLFWEVFPNWVTTLKSIRVNRPITNHMPMTEHFVRSFSILLHFEWFKMLEEHLLKLYKSSFWNAKPKDHPKNSSKENFKILKLQKHNFSSFWPLLFLTS